jgi:hypothetical protein
LTNHIPALKDEAFEYASNTQETLINGESFQPVFVVKCDSCGFVLYMGEDPKTVEAVIKMWGGVCPRCLSPLERRPIKVAIGLRRGK